MARAQSTIRAFIAIDLPGEVRTALAALTERLQQSRAKVAWVRPENLHLTLRFLGEVEVSALDRIGERLVGPLAEISPFSIRVRGVGVFPSQRRPAVIWAGIDSVPDNLVRVQELTEAAARAIDCKPETRDFVPHITLGRVRDPGPGRDLSDTLGTERAFDGGEFAVSIVTLFSSELTAKAAVHHNLREISLRWTSTSD